MTDDYRMHPVILYNGTLHDQQLHGCSRSMCKGRVFGCAVSAGFCLHALVDAKSIRSRMASKRDPIHVCCWISNML